MHRIRLALLPRQRRTSNGFHARSRVCRVCRPCRLWGEAVQARRRCPRAILLVLRYAVSNDLSLKCQADSVGACFYCTKGHTSRCLSSISLGTGVGVPGAQAEYIRVPMADACVFPLPRSIPPHLALLLADVLPTGYMTAHNALSLLSTDPPGTESKGGLGGVCVVVGCGPVGLCAIIAARTMFATVFATDPSESRRLQAEQYGATALPADALRAEVLAVTEGRGADAALEVVGNGAALRTAMSLVRPYGVVSSCGVHGQMDMDGELLYGKKYFIHSPLWGA